MFKARFDGYDVIIVGGGPAGTSAAIRLAMKGAHVLLAEQKLFPRHKLCGEFISPECLSHFSQLGVGQRMLDAGGAEITETRFYAPSGASLRVPSAWLGGNNSQALGLSRAQMDQHLLCRAREVGVDVREGAKVIGLITDEAQRVSGVHLKCEKETSAALRSTLTIDATGRARSLARHVIERPTNGRARLVAFKAHFEGAQCDPKTCEIYFYCGGYGGLNRVEGDLSNLCFITTARAVREAKSDMEKVLRDLAASNARAKETLTGARLASEWLSVALERFGRSDLVLAENLIVIGDAASFIDPFTGSGMLMALESGDVAARVIGSWIEAVGQPLPFSALANEYKKQYGRQFNSRLRYCSLLRRAAFAPSMVGEAAIRMLSASQGVCRLLAGATRGGAMANRGA